MLEALKHSNEPPHLISEAKRYLSGLKGNLVQSKKQKKVKVQAPRTAVTAEATRQYGYAGPLASEDLAAPDVGGSSDRSALLREPR